MWKVNQPQIKTLSRLTPYIPTLIGREFTKSITALGNWSQKQAFSQTVKGVHASEIHL